MDTTIENTEIGVEQAAPVAQPTPPPVPPPAPVAEAEPVAQEPEEDVLDILQPKAAVRVWKIGPESMGLEFTQRPLSFITKMEWFALVGDVMDRAMSGPNGLTVSNLLSSPTRPGGQLRPEDFKEADTFVQAIGKLIREAPDFLVKSIMIWLNVPDWQRDTVKELLSYPPEDGGLSDDDGFEIIETFIDQNFVAIQGFFTDRLGKLRDRVEARQKEIATKK